MINHQSFACLRDSVNQLSKASSYQFDWLNPSLPLLACELAHSFG